MNGEVWKNMDLEAREAWLKKETPYYAHWVGNKHRIIKTTKDLLNNRIPNPREVAVIQGIFSIKEALDNGYKPELIIVSLEDMKAYETVQLLRDCIDKQVPIYVVSSKTLKQVEELGNSQGLVAWVSLSYTTLSELALKKDSVLLILDGVEIPGNVGTILRSAEAAGVDGVVLHRRKVRVTHPKLIRSSLSAIYHVPILWEDDFDSLYDFLKREGYAIVLADATGGQAYYELGYKDRVAIVMGSEKYGVSEAWYGVSHKAAYIPMWGKLDSLNVGVAATILMYEAVIKNKGLVGGRYEEEGE